MLFEQSGFEQVWASLNLFVPQHLKMYWSWLLPVTSVAVGVSQAQRKHIVQIILYAIADGSIVVPKTFVNLPLTSVKPSGWLSDQVSMIYRPHDALADNVL